MRSVQISMTVLLAAVLLPAGVLRSNPPDGEKPLRDLTDIKLDEWGVRLVAAKKDTKTGFVVGGKNDTALIKGLTELNGRTIANLERDMRPGAKTEVGSDKGFLGADEKLLDVLAADNKYVVDELGLTHQEMAKYLYILGAIGAKLKGEEFRYHGKRFQVTVNFSKGFQLSPFFDGTRTNADAVIKNLDNGKELEISMLVPQMIERYGFYEGTGTPYRVDPKKILEILDFLKRKP